MKSYLYILVLLFNFALHAFSQDPQIIPVNQWKFRADDSLKLIVCNENLTHIQVRNSDVPLQFKVLSEVYTFTEIHDSLKVGTPYIVIKDTVPYTLYFTQLPILSISCPDTIRDEPKIASTIVLSDTTQNIIPSTAGIETRGGYTSSLPKKSYDLELWRDNSGQKTRDISFLGLREDDDWILMSLYNEPLRINNVVSHQVWLDIHKPYYLDEEPDARSGIRTRYIELFLNDEYQGIYALAEQVDKKQLGLKSYAPGTIRGELYKGSTWDATFTILPPFNNNKGTWSGYEYKQPEEVTDWSNLYELVEFVLYSSSEEFASQIAGRFNMDNLIDYYLFVNLIRATDNSGKNLYIAKYKENEPYFYVPWDLDGTWGYIWDGTPQFFDDFVSNGLYDKVHEVDPENFNLRLKERWFSLRENLFAKERLKNTFKETHDFLLNNGVYEREALKWPDYLYGYNNLQYMNFFLDHRLQFMDNFYSVITSVPSSTSGPGPLVVVSPNPSRDLIKIKIEGFQTGHIAYSIMNAQGFPVQSGKADLQNEGAIDCNDLEPGLYFLNLQKEGHLNQTHKIVIE